MAEYSKVNAKINEKTEKTENALKKKIGTTLRMNFKIFDESNLPHELLLTTRQKARLRNWHKTF